MTSIQASEHEYQQGSDIPKATRKLRISSISEGGSSYDSQEWQARMIRTKETFQILRNGYSNWPNNNYGIETSNNEMSDTHKLGAQLR